jgi:hypothetical protein
MFCNIPFSTPETISCSAFDDDVLEGVFDAERDFVDEEPDNDSASERNPDRGVARLVLAATVSFDASKADADADMVRCRRRPMTAGGRAGAGDDAGGADGSVSSGEQVGWEDRGRKAGCMVV